MGATAVATVAVAELAAWLLRPGESISPAPAAEGSYFSQAQLDRARDYATGQRLLALGALAAEGVVLVVLVAGRPRWARRALDRAGERPVLGAAAASACLFVGVQLVGLPFAVASHERAVDVGLSTQSLGAWSVDVAKATAIGGLLAAAVGSAALALIRRFGPRWWIPGSAAFIALAVLFVWVAPVVLDPVFSNFKKLPPGQARSDVLELARRAGVDVGGIYEVDASRRTTALNAYVNGIGPTKRVVLYDTLFKQLDRGERRSLIAHELTHAKENDVPRGLLFLAIATPLSLVCAYQLAAAIARRRGAELGHPVALPALMLSLAIVSFAIGVIGNGLSRRVEARADLGALETTNDPQSLVRLQRQLTITNVADPSPPGIFTFLFATHPTTMQRIGEALAWEHGSRP